MVVSTSVGASYETNTIPEGGSASATAFRSEAVDWSVADYESRYADCLDACRFTAMFSAGRNATMYDRRSVKGDTDVGGLNRR